MLKNGLLKKPAQLVAIALLLSLTAGCAQTKSFFTGKPESSFDEEPIEEVADVDDYLDEMELLASGDPAAQAEIIADSQAAARLTPGPQTSLRYALVLATPGHPESDPALAASMLRESLAAPQLLTEGEIALASIALNWAENLSIAESEVSQTRASLARSAQSQMSASSQRMAALEAENRRLSLELREAEEKLEAITSIERSIRDQE
jgi:hypothetical protein